MKNMTFFSFTHKQLLRMKQYFLVVVILCASHSCLANSLDIEKFNANPVNPKLWQKINPIQKETSPKNTLKAGTFVGYSHSLSEYLGLVVSVDSYVYTNKSDNSFAWVVGFVGELFNLNYHIDQKEKNEYLEVMTHYPLSDSLSLTGYVGNKKDGEDEYRDYSVGLAYSVNTSVKISAGIADRELKRSDAEGNIFVNIKGTF